MSRNAEDNQRMRDERREKILSCALKLFTMRGLAATKITDIAAEVGMSQGLLYHYFRSKEEIFTELVTGALTRMNAAARGLEEFSLSPREKIKLAIDKMLQGMEEDEDFARYFLLVAQASISEAIPAEAKSVIQAESSLPHEVITRIMQAGQQDGTIKPHDPMELALVFWTTFKGLTLHKAVHSANFKAPDARILTGMFFTEES